MQLKKFHNIRVLKDTVYHKNFQILMGGYPVSKMPAFITAAFMFDAFKTACPRLTVDGSLIVNNKPQNAAAENTLQNSRLVIVQRDRALLGRYMANDVGSRDSPSANVYLQISGHFERQKCDSLWPEHLIQLRTISQTDSGTLKLGPVSFNDRGLTFFTATLAPGNARFEAHSRILTNIP